MGLHKATLSGWRITTLWYQAINDRGGRWHLWDVPYYQHDKTLVRLNQETQVFSYWRQDILAKDGLIFTQFYAGSEPPRARRRCTMRQNAIRWSRTWSWRVSTPPSPDATPPWGWCARCWPIYLENQITIGRDSQSMYPYFNTGFGAVPDLAVLKEAAQRAINER
jgi:hypothetical protein